MRSAWRACGVPFALSARNSAAPTTAASGPRRSCPSAPRKTLRHDSTVRENSSSDSATAWSMASLKRIMSSMEPVASAWSAAHRRSTEARRARYSAIIWFTPKPSSARLRPWLLAADSGLVACAVRPCALSRCSAALCGVRRSATMSRRINGMSLRRRLWFNCAPSGAWVMAKSTASSRMRCMLAWMKSGSRISTSCCSFCVV